MIMKILKTNTDVDNSIDFDNIFVNKSCDSSRLKRFNIIIKKGFISKFESSIFELCGHHNKTYFRSNLLLLK